MLIFEGCREYGSRADRLRSHQEWLIVQTIFLRKRQKIT
jgi:hypothetical protein